MGWTHDLLLDASRFQYQDDKGLAFNPDLRSVTLTQLRRAPFDVLAEAGERALLAQLGALYNGGWQPVEVQRQARLEGRRVSTARLISAAIANDDARRRATTLDARWIAQVAAMDVPPADGKPGWVRRWSRAEALDHDGVRDALIDALALLWLPEIEILIPPPGSARSTTNGGTATARSSHSADRDPLLERIRALLSKAESSEFESEAMAFTAKAQELITRHAIDEALLADTAVGSDGPAIIRVPIDPPYGDAKALLLQVVAENTRCRALMMSDLDMSRVVGFAADTAAVEMLFTSLLIQSQSALARAGRSAPPGTRTRSASYRSSFLVAYATRIGDRLAEINHAVTGEVAAEHDGRLLPVLRARSDSIDDFMDEHFGHTTQSKVRGGYDSAAMAHGATAADSAQLSFGDIDSTDAGTAAAWPAELAADRRPTNAS